MFANASAERPAIYFTILGEPAIKMLRYQQQFTFFDQAKIDGGLHFVNLSQIVLDSDLSAVLDRIVKEVEASQAKMVVVDSLRTVVRKAGSVRLLSRLQVEVILPREIEGGAERVSAHVTPRGPAGRSSPDMRCSVAGIHYVLSPAGI